MKFLLAAAAVLVTLCGPVSSFPGGAPEEACNNLTPSPTAHGSPQTSAVPYFVYVDPLCTDGYLTYTPNQTYTRKFSKSLRAGVKCLLQVRLASYVTLLATLIFNMLQWEWDPSIMEVCSEDFSFRQGCQLMTRLTWACLAKRLHLRMTPGSVLARLTR